MILVKDLSIERSNKIIFENSLPEGMYTYSVSNGTNLISGKITNISDNAF